MTLREALQKYYPEHFDEIIEEMHKQSTVAESQLNMEYDKEGVKSISHAFIWSSSKQGFSYWSRIAFDKIEEAVLSGDIDDRK